MFENLSERISGISKGVLPGTEGEKKNKKRESNMKSPWNEKQTAFSLSSLKTNKQKAELCNSQANANHVGNHIEAEQLRGETCWGPGQRT